MFALRSVCFDVSERKKSWSWEHIKQSRANCREYVDLYVKKKKVGDCFICFALYVGHLSKNIDSFFIFFSYDYFHDYREQPPDWTKRDVWPLKVSWILKCCCFVVSWQEITWKKIVFTKKRPKSFILFFFYFYFFFLIFFRAKEKQAEGQSWSMWAKNLVTDKEKETQLEVKIRNI